MAQRQISTPSAPTIEIEELDQANNLVATYVRSSTNEKIRIDVVIPTNATSFARSILNAFLPAGYPHSVTSDYLEYQIYDSLQAFSSSIAGMLSSRAVLEGIGVGDSHASPTAALLLSVIQESMGRIATILFAHRLGTALEPECKMYRLAADIFNDAAMFLDCMSPALPKTPRVVLLSLSSVLRALCGVAAGSSKASLSAHFATQGNLGELNAKDSSQETIISLMGMLAGSLVVSVISSQWATWTAMIALLAIHLGTNYMAVRAVCMRTLNRQRANLVFSHILEHSSKYQEAHRKWWINKGSSSGSLPAVPDIKCLGPVDVLIQERIFEKDGVLRWQGRETLGYCKLGISLQTLLDSVSKRDTTTGSFSGSQLPEFTELLTTFKEEYILWYDEMQRKFLVVLKEGSNTYDQLFAWLHALCIAKFGRSREDEPVLETLDRTRHYVDQIWEHVSRGLKKSGWDLDIGAMETRSGTRIRMGKGDSKDLK